MRNLALATACLVLLTGVTSCSPVGSGLLGGVLGAGAAGGGYEYHLKRQKDRVEEDFKAGKIDQKEYEIRKDQIARDSFFQK
ncbi:MAG: hypothetical protein A4E19_00275 [Nitrospira sp. SG-bin1]|nr:MAG: hypothetical protein A4E19_00275 [Nitrospira sp. SG-bin1]